MHYGGFSLLVDPVFAAAAFMVGVGGFGCRAPRGGLGFSREGVGFLLRACVFLEI